MLLEITAPPQTHAPVAPAQQNAPVPAHGPGAPGGPRACSDTKPELARSGQQKRRRRRAAQSRSSPCPAAPPPPPPPGPSEELGAHSRSLSFSRPPRPLPASRGCCVLSGYRRACCVLSAAHLEAAGGAACCRSRGRRGRCAHSGTLHSRPARPLTGRVGLDVPSESSAASAPPSAAAPRRPSPASQPPLDVERPVLR